ncbi:MAG TPA: histidine kinase, partial [Caulobacteraceae bacterium]|nr:histidine kinase [Caulobacteraceae bacterium]
VVVPPEDAQPARGTRGSTVTFDQLEALGEGLIFVFDLARRRARYVSTELARMIAQDMNAPFDVDTARRLIHPDDFAAFSSYVTGLSLTGGPEQSSVTVRIIRPEGVQRWLEIRGRALTLYPDGRARTVLGVAIDVTERRAMARALDRATDAVLHAGEQERHRIARDLHDSTAQHLVAIDLGLSSLERRLRVTGEAATVMRDMRESLEAAHREIRTYSYLLHPPQLQRLGLEVTLRRFVEGLDRRSDLAIEMHVSGMPPSLPDDTELTLFRVAQEAVMNVYRHARAAHAAVRLSHALDWVVLEVEDDGIGLADPGRKGAGRSEGVGIPGMRARMAQVGGFLHLLPRDKGLCVRAEAPI